MKEMLADLNNVGVNVPKEVQLHQLLQLHSSYVTEKVAQIDSEQIKLVKYPLLNSDEISSIKFKPIAKGEIRDFARIACSHSFIDQELSDVIRLCSTFLTFHSKGESYMFVLANVSRFSQ